ncbi:hypothetical protein [Dyella ginsengisoli]|uniref:hypothetical protein n=1 Tax=Dyella ginsengisoli TaxID=363848 RepID=UPI0003495070|nr:hypothetical protein [Dyella ginsengisoli]
MKRSVFSIVFGLISAAAAASPATKPQLKVQLSVTSGDKVIATFVQTTGDREPMRFSGVADGGQQYEVELTPALLPDMPGQVMIRSSLVVVAPTAPDVIKVKGAAPLPLQGQNTCDTAAINRWPLGTASKILSGGDTNLPGGDKTPIPGCSLTVKVTEAAPDNG